MKPAIFLDRDGTIIHDAGFIDEMKDVVFFDFTFDSLLRLQKKFLLFIITNQSGISKKITEEKKVIKLHEELLKIFSEKGIIINKIFYCPHTTEEKCICKKPKPYFINKITEKYRIELKNSFVIGDHPTDMELAVNAGCKGVYVLTGHGKKHQNEIPDNFIAVENLSDAADFILSENNF